MEAGEGATVTAFASYCRGAGFPLAEWPVRELKFLWTALHRTSEYHGGRIDHTFCQRGRLLEAMRLAAAGRDGPWREVAALMQARVRTLHEPLGTFEALAELLQRLLA